MFGSRSHVCEFLMNCWYWKPFISCW